MERIKIWWKYAEGHGIWRSVVASAIFYGGLALLTWLFKAFLGNISLGTALKVLTETTFTFNLLTITVVACTVTTAFLLVWKLRSKPEAKVNVINSSRGTVATKTTSIHRSIVLHDEINFPSFHKIQRELLTDDALTMQIANFMSGEWQMIRKLKGEIERSRVIMLPNTPITLSYSPKGSSNGRIEIRSISYDRLKNRIDFKKYNRETGTVVFKETISIENDELMTGMDDQGWIVTYRREGLFKAIH